MVMMSWKGRGEEPNQADTWLGNVITGKEQNHRFRW